MFLKGTEKMKKIEKKMIVKKIEKQMINAIDNCIENGIKWTNGNTEVSRDSDGFTNVFLHDNRIATFSDDMHFSINNCGWKTQTTKSRLNAILSEFMYRDLIRMTIRQKKGEWYLCTDYRSLNSNIEVEQFKDNEWHIICN
jgi:hypothetical protein